MFRDKKNTHTLIHNDDKDKHIQPEPMTSAPIPLSVTGGQPEPNQSHISSKSTFLTSVSIFILNI